MKLPQKISAVTLLLALCIIPAGVNACIFDPILSSYIYPTSIPDCREPVAVSILARCSNSSPVVSAVVTVQIILVSGVLEPDQVVSAQSITDAGGRAEVTFPNGISGTANFYFDTYIQNILADRTNQYAIATGDCPIPVTPVTWGGVKARFY